MKRFSRLTRNIIISWLFLTAFRIAFPHVYNAVAARLIKMPASTIGIIGGADGPTAIFISKRK